MWQVWLASAPIFLVLAYFLYAAPAYSIADISSVVASFLLVAQMWAILAVYLIVYVPRRHRLLKRYVQEGRTVMGDVFVGEDEDDDKNNKRTCCFNLLSRNDHHGRLVYNPDGSGGGGDGVAVTVTKTVRIYENFTRERILVLLLPEDETGLGGLSKPDTLYDLEIATLNADKRDNLAFLSLVWVAFGVVGPIYVLWAKGGTALLAWVAFAVVVAFVLPLVAFACNEHRW